ncbi:MAG: hypothetical protein CTY14_05900 [Methylotenera sp.]|jgi:hypothetical protein|nr:MAG: hypothetical protein CTY14_05900 [Methylotenera sp.]
MSYSKVIVTTSINSPTEALLKYARIEGWHLVVVGDLKTPTPFNIEGATYLSPSDQEKLSPRLSDLIGWNCIQRRNLGFIWAIKQGALLVATIDDDNIPYENWGNESLVGQEIDIDFYQSSVPAFDPISVTEHSNLWHRGFPIQWLTERKAVNLTTKKMVVDVEAGFWNGDPDIDAICRMEHSPQLNFSEKSFPFAGGPMAPFNSQNTILSAKAISEYFLFPKIGRMDDIWAAFWLQSKGFNVVFNKASVFQKRNEHDLTKDFELEVLGYTKSYKLIASLLAEGPDSIWNFLPDGSKTIYDLYKKELS